LQQQLMAAGVKDGDLVDAKLVGGVVVERLLFRERNLWLSADGGERRAPFDSADVVDVRLTSWRPSWWWPA
jgi:hypothetical protein